MSIARVTEISATSDTGFEDAVREARPQQHQRLAEALGDAAVLLLVLQ